MVSLDFSPLNFITNKKCSVYDSCVLVSPVSNCPLDFQIISHSCLYFSIKLKRTRELLSLPPPALDSPLNISCPLLFPTNWGKVQLPLSCWVSCLCSPTFQALRLPLPAEATALYSPLFFCMKHHFIFCSLLLQEIFINVTELIRCQRCERWRHSIDVLLTNIHASPGEDFSYQIASLCLQRTNGMSWNNYSGAPDLKSNSCYW